jgi:hypothetical protein
MRRWCAELREDGQAIYSAIASLDGYVADEHGRFARRPGRGGPSLVNDLERPVGTYLGRRT